MIPEIVVYYLLTFAGFTPAEAHVMTCVARYESGLRPNAVNLYNKNQTIDLGLFQINSIHWNRSNACTLDTLSNPMYNSLCAKEIYDLQGFGAWVAWQKNKLECNTYVVGGVK